MYVFDHRERYKGAEELHKDKQNIMRALEDLFKYDLFIYDLASRQELKGNKKSLRARVEIIDEKGYSGVTAFTSSFFKSFLLKSVKDFQGMAYGDVVYLREIHNEEDSTIYVWLKGVTLLTIPYRGSVDLWQFSLHYQNAIKSHEEVEFQERLSVDKRFFEKDF